MGAMMRKITAALTIITGLFAASAAVGQSDQPPAPSPADTQLKSTLLANAWCSSAPDPDSGDTVQAHAQFSTDGSLEVTRTSGGAQISSQIMGWKVEGGQLLLQNGNSWQVFPLTAGKRADGKATVASNGSAWSAC